MKMVVVSERGMTTKSREKTLRVAVFSEMYGPPCADCFFFFFKQQLQSFPRGSEVKASASNVSASNAGDRGLIPGSGRSPGEENGNPLQYSCLENPMDRGAWQATVHGVAKSRT